jgi:hypothetical protein
VQNNFVRTLRMPIKIILFFVVIVSLAVNAVLITKPADLAAFLPENNNGEIRAYIEQVVFFRSSIAEPTIAEITDIDSLKEEDPALYQYVENGDKVFIYTDVVVIYRPDKQKIVQVIQIGSN